jgi:branched-subunit amino acid transport protein
MNETVRFLLALLAMAGTTYLIRMLPMVLVKKKITNTFVRSFLYYIPYAVLSVMTIPAIFYATGNTITAWAGFIVAMILAYMGKSLVTVAAFSCVAVLIFEIIL